MSNELLNDRLKSLISAVENNRPNKILIPLIMGKFHTTTKSKFRFFQWFKKMVHDAHLSVEGSIRLEIENYTWENIGEEYLFSFYDETHPAPRLNMMIQVLDDKIRVDVFPF